MKLKVVLAIIVSVALGGCQKKDKESKEPTACFTIDKSFPKPAEIVNFSNCSQNYTRVEWNFGDGGSSTISDPTYRYILPGAYTVKLKTFNGTKWQETSQNIIATDNILLHYDISYTGKGINSGDLLEAQAYYQKKNSSTFTSFGTVKQYHKDGDLLKASFTAEGSDSYTIKFVVKVYRGYKNSQSMLPDILFAADSLTTEGIEPLTGNGISTSTKNMSMLTATQKIYLTY